MKTQYVLAYLSASVPFSNCYLSFFLHFPPAACSINSSIIQILLTLEILLVQRALKGCMLSTCVSARDYIFHSFLFLFATSQSTVTISGSLMNTLGFGFALVVSLHVVLYLGFSRGLYAT